MAAQAEWHQTPYQIASKLFLPKSYLILKKHLTQSSTGIRPFLEKPAQIRLKDYMTMVSSDDEKNFVDQWDVGG